MMRVFVFGNPDLPQDSLPLRILPELRKCFPQISFEVKDPHEEWESPSKITILDTVCGIGKVTVFTGLSPFVDSPKLTVHDFDALSNLQLLQKLGKLKEIRIIGIPPDRSEKEALKEVTTILQSNLL